MPTPIITFDIDGTLVSPDDRIHPADLAILNNPPAGVVLVPNTGRPLVPVVRLLHKHGAFTEYDRLPIPLVTQNGGAIYGPDERLLAVHAFSPELYEQVLAIMQDYPDVTTLVTTTNGIYSLYPTNFAADKAVYFDFSIEPLSAFDHSDGAIKMMQVSDRLEDLRSMSRRAAELPVVVTSSLPFIVEVNPLGVDKCSGLQRLLEHSGLAGSPVYAAGDGGNDIPLLRAATRSFAPATSPAAVQAVASEVVDVFREGILLPMLRAAGVIRD